ncbi:efflux RND transporter periplasmic adaptor subunit [Plastoroseomonas hellenica]|uniref:efflux RND transporter periplasmic adaptor subunit n=1 Tax=Plastoroseomonas hellenica TaxID=2687306 RepID=UPI001BA89316|nr:efflux RND transporter periplasmic adaptor subunit [Plastoroseomonas hellenica]MBR0645495.1 efflux RND transporter periplasmic adaptor subunit [Plastoroseomonas hellenica]
MPPAMRRRLLILSLLVSAVGAAAFWWTLPPTVAIAVATRGPALEAIYATGNVEPVQWARVGPAIRGRVMRVLVEEGDRVTTGQPLAQLDDREAAARVAEAEARAAFAQEDLQRIRTLVARDIAARAQLDRAESEARAARALLDASLRRLDDLVVRAHADGTVLRRDVEPGQIADVPDALFWVGEPRPLRINAEVDEEDIARVSVGQRVLLRADAFPGRVLPATVTQITPKGDTTRKSYRVRMALPDDTPLHIGMSVEANIVLREETAATLIPPAALRDGHVFVIEKELVRRRPVTIGVQGARAVEIRDGLSPGDSVVLDPPARLADGQHVRLRAGGAVAGPAQR